MKLRVYIRGIFAIHTRSNEMDSVLGISTVLDTGVASVILSWRFKSVNIGPCWILNVPF